MPFDRSRYPKDWPEISRRTRTRSGGRCEGPPSRPPGVLEGRCEARQGEPHPISGSRVVLTVAHLDHDPQNSDPANLRALCQRCHLNYDRPRHLETARVRRRARLACGDLFLGPYRLSG